MKITIRKGLKADLPVLAEGELGLCTDTEELYIGTSTGNVLVQTGVDDFLDLGDTPSSYTGQSGKAVQVKTTEDGLEFVTPGGGGGGLSQSMFRRTGSYYTSFYSSHMGNSAYFERSTLFAMPFLVPDEQSFDRIACDVYDHNANTDGVCRLGIYQDNNSIYPGSLVVDGGELDCSTDGIKEAIISQTLSAGLFWLVMNSNGSNGDMSFFILDYAESYASAWWGILGLDPLDAATIYEPDRIYYQVAQTYGALPASFPAGASREYYYPIEIFLRKA